MKIAIGINNFKKEEELNHREKMCVDSLLKIKELYPEIELFNLTFEDELFATLNNFKNYTLPKTVTKRNNKQKNTVCERNF
jgi:hypothetical protein